MRSSHNPCLEKLEHEALDVFNRAVASGTHCDTMLCMVWLQVKAALYHNFAGVCWSLGQQGIASYILPFLERMIDDSDPTGTGLGVCVRGGALVVHNHAHTCV